MNTDCIVSEIQLKYKPQPLTETLCSSKEINQLLIKRIFDEETIGYKETFKVLLLNQAKQTHWLYHHFRGRSDFYNRRC